MIYHSFAQYYDELFDPDMYRDWKDYVEMNTAPGSRLLDLAGGAGRLCVLLAQDGYHTTDLDFSTDMLTLASQHAIEAQVNVELIEANMLDLSALNDYDVITCFADSLCYLKDANEVSITFQQVHQHLGKHGLFLFDVITPYQTDHVYPGYMYNYRSEDNQRFFMWSSFQNDDIPHGVIHELSFFDQQANGSYQRLSETHFERSYSLNHLKQMLRQAGFTNIVASANFGKKQVNAQNTRWFFKCQVDD